MSSTSNKLRSLWSVLASALRRRISKKACVLGTCFPIHTTTGLAQLTPPSVDRNKYQIQIPLPPKIDAFATMMRVGEKPNVTYSDVDDCRERIEKLREVAGTHLLSVRSSILSLALSLTGRI